MEERKSNKKTRNIIIVAILLLLLAILCICGTTLARYITKANAPAQQATVAKWGFVVNANATDLFGAEYKNGVKVNAGTDGVDVKASANVIAPGTKGSMTFSVAGSAEVMAQITIAVPTGVTLKDVSLTKGADVYNPLKWTLKSGTTAGTYDTEVATGTLAEVIAKAAKSETLAPGSTAVAYYYQLSWEWTLHVDDATDVKDTILGFAATATTTEATYGNYKVVKGSDGVITVTDTKGTEATDDDETYTAVVDVNVALNIAVEQIQAPVTAD